MSTPIGNGSKVCRHWSSKGWCGFGSNCRFLHTNSPVGDGSSHSNPQQASSIRFTRMEPLQSRRARQADEDQGCSRSAGKRSAGDSLNNEGKIPRKQHTASDSGRHSSSRKRPASPPVNTNGKDKKSREGAHDGSTKYENLDRSLTRREGPHNSPPTKFQSRTGGNFGQQAFRSARISAGEYANPTSNARFPPENAWFSHGQGKADTPRGHLEDQRWDGGTDGGDKRRRTEHYGGDWSGGSWRDGASHGGGHWGGARGGTGQYGHGDVSGQVRRGGQDGRDGPVQVRRFVKQLGSTPVSHLSSAICSAGQLWTRVWQEASGQGLNQAELEMLILCLAKLPFSSDVAPPPLRACHDSIGMFISATKGEADARVLNSVEVTLNVVTRLLKFEWEQSVAEVQQALTNLLTEATTCLRMQHEEHRAVMQKLLKKIEEVEKPWAVKCKMSACLSEEVDAGGQHTWRQATVGWLAKIELFAPPELPVMKTPVSKSGGVYTSTEEYLATVAKLWEAMTFSDGCAALTPQCHHKVAASGKACGNTMWPRPKGDVHELPTCRSRGCRAEAWLVCSNKHHNHALCRSCARSAAAGQMGPPGRSASTHIYDGVIKGVHPVDGRIFVERFESRSPPQHPVHWYSTKRLSCPNLAGLVKLSGRGAGLRHSDPIVWVRIVEHGLAKEESNRRQQGQVALSMADISTDFDTEGFANGDNIAIIDCQTFVPEFIPVLKALGDLTSLPFDNGRGLNLIRDLPPEASCMVSRETFLSGSFQDDHQSLVADLIAKSALPPLVEIRRDAGHTRNLQRELVALLKETKPDSGQLLSWVNSLRCPVHLTQGPPGTGKSYLGVVIVRALIIIRSFWIRANPSVGVPPILVLSYKNHAIDEFLVDLVQAEGGRMPAKNLIRIGKKCDDPRLQRYTEKSASNDDYQVRKHKTRINNLHVLATASEDTRMRTASFLAYQTDMFQSSREADKNSKRMSQTVTASNEAAEMLMSSLVRVAQLEPIVNGSDGHILTEDSFSVLSMEQPWRQCERENLLSSIQALHRGFRHYGVDEPHDILLMWIRGVVPLPQCSHKATGGQQCTELCARHGDRLCNLHKCTVCDREVVCETKLCADHSCRVKKCRIQTVGFGQQFCRMHACFKCLELEPDRAARAAQDEPPRHVCAQHQLCSAVNCMELCSPRIDFCERHDRRRAGMCSGLNKKGNKCSNRAVSRTCSFCRVHKWQQRLEAESESDNDPELAPEERTPVVCAGLTKTRRRPCKALALFPSRYCEAHAFQEPEAAIKAARTFEEQKHSTAALGASAPDAPGSQRPQSRDGDEGVKHIPNDGVYTKRRKVLHQTAEAEGKTIPGADAQQTEPTNEGIEASGSECGSHVSCITADLGFDNQDEVEGEQLQHLRDVFETRDEDSEDAQTDEGKEWEDEEHGVTSVGSLDAEGRHDSEWLQHEPSEWSWDMPIEERWNACQAFMSRHNRLLGGALKLLYALMRTERKSLHIAKVKASAKVFEDKSVIGGTIVGCIARLEAIRSTNPFAIVVEEASEVLEPLLASCFCSSTCKLEMIGDHLQLQPLMMSKYEFEIVNKVNLSMFERLIRAPEPYGVPSDVLSVQRRMRKNLCDITREYYAEIVTIEDHEVCSTRCIPGDARRSVTGGREVPGLQGHMFLWTHQGAQAKASVGLSKVNPTEANMACSLAEYLVDCGAPRRSVAILTPYKGQLMLIRKQLLRSKNKLLLWNAADKDQCRLSTVDRFQGDEADIVILSLVVDEHTPSGFVKLRNRMIVALSRARLGLYVLSNWSYFEKSPVQHWRRTLEWFQSPTLSDSPAVHDDSPHLWTETRVGSELPLCCPLHGETRAMVSASNLQNLKLGFCRALCEAELQCSHRCGMRCHWPSDSHNIKCSTLVNGACVRHPEPIPCVQVFANAPGAKGASVALALTKFRCPQLVPVMMPCSHTIQMKCCEETDISKGKSQFPQCSQPAHSPYIYPACQHSLACLCFETELYSREPSRVKKCMLSVQFLPPCQHICTVQCYLKQLFQSGSLVFSCPQKESVILPRCGHEARRVPCQKVIQLANWAGAGCCEQGVVIFGKQYGPVDYPCVETARLRRPCGHEETMPCERAFEVAVGGAECRQKVACVNPVCGHHCEVLCHHADIMRALPQPPPADAICEGSEPKRSMRSLLLAMSSSLPPSFNVHCTRSVVVKRKCGHVVTVRCSDARGTLPPCSHLVQVKSPFCGHTLKILCADSDIQDWEPWDHQTKTSVHGEQTIPKAAVLQRRPADHLSSSLSKCEGTLTVTRMCQHQSVVPCKVALSLHLDGPGKHLGKCTTSTLVPLACQHEAEVPCWRRQSFLDGSLQIPCNETKYVPCWNQDVCGMQRLPVRCSSTKVACCDSSSRWTCEAKTHTFELQLCIQGLPQNCPGCALDLLARDLQNAQESKFEMCCSLPDWLQQYRWSKHDVSEAIARRFQEGLVSILSNYKTKEESLPLWKRHVYSSCLSPCFIRLDTGNRDATSFTPKTFLRAATLAGIKVMDWTAGNLKHIADTPSNEHGSETLLFGYCFALDALVNPEWPTGKKTRRVVKQWHDNGVHCAYFANQHQTTLIFWEPFPLYATHRVTLSKAELQTLAQNLADGNKAHVEPPKVSFSKPKENMVMVATAVGTVRSSSGNVKNSCSSRRAMVSLQETKAKHLVFDADWDPERLSQAAQTLSVGLEQDLRLKLEFANRSAPKFAGKNLLEAHLRRESPSILLHLFMSLELLALDGDRKTIEIHLNNYLENQPPRCLTHPLALLALARLSDESEAARLVDAFCRMFGAAGERWLLTGETAGMQKDAASGATAVEMSLGEEVKEQWEELKTEQGCVSQAMEELLALTGLARVKKDALQLFKTGLKFASMPDEARKLNAPTLNYSFLGNPGTGKTTVGNLFARILHDAGLRKNKTFKEVTAQELKDGGTDDFRKQAKAAEDGVLFIDESYELDPFGDYKGKPIVAELLSLSEKQRHSLSIILAGYEDDMNRKLFAANAGLASRFTTVAFDDFDRHELKEIWLAMLSERKWQKPEERITQAVMRRLVAKANKKGFANARAVRIAVEAATTCAMARDSFDSSRMSLEIMDVVGEDPLNNPKIQHVLDELDDRVGWKSVKRAVQDMIQLCSANYKRETNGKEPNPVSLNRLFLGNPGTGKTTCAKIYGKMLKHLGFLSDGAVVETSAATFGGSVVGEAQKKALQILDGAQGKVLLIDEAYSLDDDQYGKQVLNTIVEKVSGSAHDDIAVLLLGYEDPIMKMISNQNPGLASRFPRDSAFVFEDYDSTELLHIMKVGCKKQNVELSLNFQQQATRALEKQKQLGNFGNARAVETLIRDALQRATVRCPENPGSLRLEAEDVATPSEDDTDPLNKLDSLYGVDGIRKQLQRMRDAHAVAEEEGESAPDLGHFVFTGAPGTGKTTVARLLGEILCGMNLIQKQRVVETTGLELTSEYTGQTKKKVEERLKKAKGGVLFIDEAYELGKGTFGAEALTAIVAAMTDPQYKGIIFIIAGYREDIDKMLDVNVGLKSRFTQFLQFPDWVCDDCMQFVSTIAARESLRVEDAGLGLLRRGFEELIGLAGWGNARDVKKLWEAMKSERAVRVKAHPEEERLLTAADVKGALNSILVSRGGGGLVEDEQDPLAALDCLYRIESVKDHMQKLQASFEVWEQEGCHGSRPNLGHFVLTGSPGTGKTTVARVITKILYRMKLLRSNRFEETSGLDMTGEYTGQTKKKVEERLKKAKGGVLFIDEAYELGKGTFGAEALTAIVAAMTDPEYSNTVIIIAGYREDIDKMLDVNVGLKSRFTQFLQFPDWVCDDCMQFVSTIAARESLRVEDAGLGLLRRGFEELIGLAGWGNARDVKKLWEAMKSERAVRVKAHPEEERLLTAADVRNGVDPFISRRRVFPAAVGGACSSGMASLLDHNVARVPLASGNWERISSRAGSVAQDYVRSNPPQDASFRDASSRETADSVAKRTAQDTRAVEARTADQSNSVDTEADEHVAHEVHQSDEMKMTRERGLASGPVEAHSFSDRFQQQDARKEGPDDTSSQHTISSSDERDTGVSDEVWRELQESKRQERERQHDWDRQIQEHAKAEEEAKVRAAELEREHQNEIERIQREEEVQRRQHAIREAEAKQRERERKLAEERRRREEAQRILQEEAVKARAVQEKLQRLNPCPMGFNWFRQGGGWRCRGGSHFVSDDQLKSFMQ